MFTDFTSYIGKGTKALSSRWFFFHDITASGYSKLISVLQLESASGQKFKVEKELLLFHCGPALE